MKGRLLYQETQSFRGTWSWYLVIGGSLWMLWIFGKGFYQQIIQGELWGNQPMSDSGLIIVFLSVMLLMIGIFTFLSIHNLGLQVDEGTIRYRFYPYFGSYRSVHRDMVKSVEVRRYKPIWEYGGWGYRIRPGKGKAFNIAGDWGLQLVFSNGKKLLIGTQNPIELEKAIAQLKENWQMT